MVCIFCTAEAVCFYCCCSAASQLVFLAVGAALLFAAGAVLKRAASQLSEAAGTAFLGHKVSKRLHRV